MTTLAEFHSDVASALGRGTSLDTVIPSRVRQAVRWIERNYTFQYMRRWLTGSIDSTLEDSNRISLYAIRPKAIELFRLIDPEETDPTRFIKLRRIDPGERSTRRGGEPSAYWLDGINAIILDAIPENDYNYEMHIVQFTAWPSNQNDFEHWLIDNAEDMLLFTTLWYTGVHLRDDRLIQTYKLLRDEAMKTLDIAEQDIQHNDRDTTQLWTPLFEDNFWEEDNDVDR